MQSVSLDNFRKEINSAIVSRGRDYFNAGKVLKLEDNETQVDAVVQGTEKYQVRLSFENNLISKHTCTCPRLGAWCKHKVAALFSLQMKRRSSAIASIENAVQKSVSLQVGNSDEKSIKKKNSKEKNHYNDKPAVRKQLKVSAIGKLPDSLFDALPADDLSRHIMFLYLVYENNLPDEILFSIGPTVDKQKIKSVRDRLEDHKFLDVSKSWRETKLECNHKYVFPLLFYVLDRHREWFLAEHAYIEEKNKKFLDLWVICVALYDENINTFIAQQKKHFWLDTEIESLKAVFVEPYYHPLALTLDCYRFVDLLDDVLIKCLYTDILTQEFINAIHSLICDYKNQNLGSDLSFIEDKLQTYNYFLTGIPPEITVNENSSIWACACSAIRLMYEGKYVEALSLFDIALKKRNKNADDKNLFDDSILCYYLMICYAKIGNETVIARAKQYVKKDISNIAGQTIAKIVAKYIVLNEPIDNLSQDIHFLRYQNLPLFDYFANLFINFFHLDIKAINTDTNLVLLKNEKLLFSLSLKEQWEKVLDDLLLVNRNDDNNDNINRIVYVIKENSRFSRIDVYSQKWLKSNSWGAPAKLSIKHFLANICNFMDEQDRQIAAYLNKIISQNNSNPIETHILQSFLPFLVDSNKVFVEHNNQFRQVSVRKEKAFLNIEHKNGEIYLSSNLVLNENNRIESPAIIKENSTSYLVIETTPFEQTLFTNLLCLKKMPLQAEEKLRLFIERFYNKVEIHSDMIQGGSTLEKISGDTTVFLCVKQEKNMFDVECFVQPLNGGSLHIFPAYGKKEIFDEADGKRYHISRNLKSEENNLSTLNEYMSAEKGFYFEKGKNHLTADDLLCLLEFVMGKEQYAILWQEGKKINLKKPDPHFDFILSKKQKWFEVEGQWEIDKNTRLNFAELLQLTKQNLVGTHFLKLSENDYIALTKQLTGQLLQLQHLLNVDSKKAVLPNLEIQLLADILQQNNGLIQFDEKANLLLQKIEEAENLDVTIPKALYATLRDYQKEGFDWISRLSYWGAGACLADDMGLGKTVEAITFLLSKAEQGACLVVAPALLIYNWKSELNRFAPTLNALVFNQTTDREKMIKDTGRYDIVITTYGLLVREENLFLNKQWNVVCLDEAHVIKNQHTKMAQVSVQLDSKHRLALTGTPLQNNLSELWTLFEFINPGLLGSHERFVRDFVVPIETEHNKNCQTILKRMIQPFILRRTKSEVALELPEKTDIIRHIQLSEKERLYYEALRLETARQVDAADKVDVNILASITKLRQAACSFSLVDKTANDNSLTSLSSKLEDFSQLVGQIIEGGNQLLVFSQFTSFLKMAEKVIEQISPNNSLYLDGSTTLPKRNRMVDDFNHAKKQVFLISLRAGGLGLNLTAANYVIHLDPWWNPAVEQQATDRAYRIGQHQNVTVYHFIASDTIEQNILKLQQSKKDIADALLQGQNTTHTLTLEDLKLLVQSNLTDN